MQVDSMSLNQAVAALRELPKLRDLGDSIEHPDVSRYRAALVTRIEKFTQDSVYVFARNSLIPKASVATRELGNGVEFMRAFLCEMDRLWQARTI